MAKVFGKASKYLSNQEQKHRKIAKLALYIVTALAGILSAFALNTITRDQDINSKIWSFGLCGAVYLVVVWRILVYYSVSDKSAGQYLRGGQGEDAVFEILNLLPANSYWLWRDVKIDYGNIDFVLARTRQIFSIEVKNIPGRISFNGYELLNHGREIKSGNYLQQAQKQALFLKAYLKQTFGHEVSIVPIVVFAHKDVWIDFDTRKSLRDGIYVLPARMLKGFIEHFPDSNTSLNMPLLELALGKLIEK